MLCCPTAIQVVSFNTAEVECAATASRTSTTSKYASAFTRGNDLPRNRQTLFCWQGAYRQYSTPEARLRARRHSSPALKGWAFCRERGVSRGIHLIRPSGVRILGTIAAGSPLDLFNDTGLPETLDLGAHAHIGGSAPDSQFALRVRGDSMIEEGILDGDYVLVQLGKPRLRAPSSSRYTWLAAGASAARLHSSASRWSVSAGVSGGCFSALRTRRCGQSRSRWTSGSASGKCRGQ